MKKVIFILAIATALVFAFSCKKDSGSKKSVLESFTETYWSGNIAISGKPNARFIIACEKADTLWAGIDSTGTASPDEYGATYIYTNPQIVYTLIEGPDSGKVVTGTVAKDGESLTLDNVPKTGVTTTLSRVYPDKFQIAE